ncbi:MULTISPECIES: hypothetical protein [unclassified Bradyrhizobium]|uniref:hypothetical protein n=1 Tax=unclassified Bradyrhizobium TaxID=2631580 RepID=UPI002479C811|nr:MULTISPECIES: hypothetical protein [unclassified Bradyrhizobium]WGR67835.1 hypothetical protein MTX24_20415 [Bradyrhizobium sp. ISRA426]WGR79888.1 hypothetical protein MTX21_05530 [Bradyrhizobium sp. ISRA430]WGR83074.1 hypothetical protein MTX25_20095 [Bradyrhizobium sp. ISRA432]
MAYDSNDDRSNNPKAVLRRAGFTIVNKSIPEGYMRNQSTTEIGRKITPSGDGSGWGDNGKLG